LCPTNRTAKREEGPIRGKVAAHGGAQRDGKRTLFSVSQTAPGKQPKKKRQKPAEAPLRGHTENGPQAVRKRKKHAHLTRARPRAGGCSGGNVPGARKNEIGSDRSKSTPARCSQGKLKGHLLTGTKKGTGKGRGGIKGETGRGSA